MSIMDMFRTLSGNQAAQQPVQTATNAPATAQTQPGQNPPANSLELPASQQQAQTQVSPLDEFQKLWENDPNTANQKFDPNSLFSIDQSKMDQALASVDFTSGIKQEDLQAVVAGGEGAVAALANLLNGVGRQVLAANTKVGANMIQSAVGKVDSGLDQRINGQVRLSQVHTQLTQDNPALSSPAVAPLVELMKQQFTTKYPTASPQEIAQLTTRYFTEVGNAFTGKPNADSPESGGGETDWAKYIS